MLIDLAKIMSVKDKVEHIEVLITQDRVKLDGAEYEFLQKDPVKLTITNLGNRKVLVEGDTKLSLKVPCSRCLEDVAVKFDIDISKTIDFNDTDQDRIKELDETNYISGYNLDVDLLIFDEIMIDFPLKVVCSEDCKGLCNVCGMNLNHGTCNCESTSLDPRMSAIRDIFNNFKEV